MSISIQKVGLSALVLLAMTALSVPTVSQAQPGFEYPCRLSSVTDPTHYPSLQCELTPRMSGCIDVTFELRTDDPCVASTVTIFRRAHGASSWVRVETIFTGGNVTQIYTDCPPTPGIGLGGNWEYRLEARCQCGPDFALDDIELGPIQCNPE